MGQTLENPTRAQRRAAMLGRKRSERKRIGRAHWNLRKRSELAGYKHKDLLEGSTEAIKATRGFFSRIISAIIRFFRSLFSRAAV